MRIPPPRPKQPDFRRGERRDVRQEQRADSYSSREATLAEIDRLCAEAMANHFASVCVNGSHVRRCAEILANSGVLVCSVIGFPLGAMASEVKAYEARRAIEDGACEIDMVINIGALKARDLELVAKDIRGVVTTAHAGGATANVMLKRKNRRV